MDGKDTKTAVEKPKEHTYTYWDTKKGKSLPQPEIKPISKEEAYPFRSDIERRILR